MSSKINFTNSESVCVNFDSIKKVENKLVRDNLCQTNQIEYRDKALQSQKTKSAKVQTESQIEEEIMLYEDDSDELVSFMKRIGPSVCAELERCSKSFAFSNYSPLVEEKKETIEAFYEFKYKEMIELKMQISQVSWNSTGSVLAICYRHSEHSDWCTGHKSAIVTWNIDKYKVDTDKPDIIIDTSACMSALRYHPKLPSILATANFHGDISVYDTSDEMEPCIASSIESKHGHNEPVNALQWILNSDDKTYNVISCGFDGNIIVWHLSRRNQCLRMLQRYSLSTNDLPSRIRTRAASKRAIAVTCMSVSRLDRATFLIGAESGGIFRCCLDTGIHSEEHEPESPVKVSYVPHKGHVFDVDLSPFHRNLFVSCSSDQTVKISSLVEMNDSLLTIEPCDKCSEYVTQSVWSPQKPKLIVIGTSTGKVMFYDLTKSKVKSEKSIPSTSNCINTIIFNPKQPHLMAIGDSSGSVFIWKLDNSLCEVKANELESLNDLIVE